MGGLVVVADPRRKEVCHARDSQNWLIRVKNSALSDRLGNLAGDALHAEILRDNVHDARMDPSCGNWASGVDKEEEEIHYVHTASKGL